MARIRYCANWSSEAKVDFWLSHQTNALLVSLQTCTRVSCPCGTDHHTFRDNVSIEAPHLHAQPFIPACISNSKVTQALWFVMLPLKLIPQWPFKNWPSWPCCQCSLSTFLVDSSLRPLGLVHYAVCNCAFMVNMIWPYRPNFQFLLTHVSVTTHLVHSWPNS